MRNHHLQIIVLLLIATLYATASIAAGLPAPQDVLDQLKKLYPNPIAAEIFPKGDQFEVLFLSPDHPTSCLVDVATHRLSNCHYDDVESQQQSLGEGVTAGLNRAAVASDPCIDVKQTRTFSFEGVLAYKVFAGPPNYEDVRRGDTPESTYILQLNRPICVSGDDFIFKDQKIDRVHIYPEYSDKEKQTLRAELRRLIGKRVVVEGKSPFGAHTGHHHAPIVLPITKITIASASDPTSYYGTAMTTVQGFYRALEVGDGNEAAKFIVPQKSKNGPLSAAALTSFYRDMAEPLRLLYVTEISSTEYRVHYTYSKYAAARCAGTSLVRTIQINELNLIASISALNGC